MASFDKERAIDVVYKRGNKFTVDKDAVKKILLQPELEKVPLCIISIAGTFRKGKSFMLNFFLRYLKNRGYEKKGDMSWMGAQSDKLDGFDWSGGSKAVTNGILMWNKAFMVNTRNGKVAVILMDTQGLFDNDTDSQTNTLIFAISTLISSVQVFNLSQQVQENDLGFLQYFTEYAKVCRDGDNPSGKPPFQRLVFLVRDWPHPANHEYGFDGGETYLAKFLLENSKNKEIQSVREYIQSSFEDIKCCLLPYPGSKVAVTKKCQQFTGKLEDIKKEFLEELGKFVEGTLHPDNLVIKAVLEEPVSAETLYKSIIKLGEYAENGSLPKSFTLMEVHAENKNFKVENYCVAEYKKAMKKELDDNKDMHGRSENMTGKWLEDTELRKLHQQHQQKAFKLFEENTKFGPEECRATHRDDMKKRIEEAYSGMRENNKLRKSKYESTLKTLVAELVGDYREHMKKETKDEKALTEEKLKEHHEKLLRQKLHEFQQKKMQETEMRRNSMEKMIERIAVEFSTFKYKNDKKINEEKEKNMGKKTLMSISRIAFEEYESKMDLREYQEEKKLKRNHDLEKRKAIFEYERRAQEVEDVPEMVVEDQKEKLIENIKKSFEYFRDRNDYSKDELRSKLEVSRRTAAKQFTDYFVELLSSKYQQNLKGVFDQKVAEYVDNEKYKWGEKMGMDVYREHVAELERMSEDKYAMMENKNEENKKVDRCSIL